MSFYSEKILPYLFDWSLSSASLAPYRQQLLKDVKGEVLEIGFGTGINLSYYPASIHRVVTVDPNPGVHRLAEKRIQASNITVDHHILTGENLPMPSSSFDSIVSTFTLCSITNVQQALQEIHRVLKPGGQFFFLEHGLSPDPTVQIWQNRLTPIQRIIADGCHFNRNIRELVEQQFETVQLENFYLEQEPKFVGYLYKGIATKPL